MRPRLPLRLPALLPALLSLALGACRPAPGPRAFDWVIGVSMANLTEPWRINMRDEIMAEAAHHPDLRMVFTDAADSSARQIQDVRTLLDSGIDLLIISPNQSEALSPVVAEAYRRIPVILLDRSVVGFDYTLFIGPDNRLIGKQAGQYVASLLGARGGKIVEILGRSGSPPVLDRSIGFQEAIAQQGNITIVDTLVADWLRDKAEDELTSWLKRNGPVDVIMAQNDAMADGARRAAMKLGIQGLQVVGIDGLPGPGGGIELVKSGALAATFTCPTGGKEAVISALDILHHEEGIPKKMILRTSLVTRQSIESGALAASPRPRLPSPDHRIVLGFAQVGKESDWRLANTESIKTAAREAGIELLFRDGEQKQENQIKAIREFIAKEVDVIAFSANVESGWGEVLREAKAARIPVFIIDRPVDEKDESLWVSLMGSDFVEEGRRAARWLIGYLNTGKPVNIVELQGTVGSAPAIDRKIGFEEVLQRPPQLPHHRVPERGFLSQRRPGGHAADPPGPGRQQPAHGRAVRPQRRHGHRGHRGHGSHGAEAGQGRGHRLGGRDPRRLQGHDRRQAELLGGVQPAAGPAVDEGGQGLHVRQGPARAHRHLGSGVPGPGGPRRAAQPQILIW